MQTKKITCFNTYPCDSRRNAPSSKPVFAINRSTYSQGSTNDKKYGMGAYAAYWNNYGNHWAEVTYGDKYGGRVVSVHANQQAMHG